MSIKTRSTFPGEETPARLPCSRLCVSPASNALCAQGCPVPHSVALSSPCWCSREVHKGLFCSKYQQPQLKEKMACCSLDSRSCVNRAGQLERPAVFKGRGCPVSWRNQLARGAVLYFFGEPQYPFCAQNCNNGPEVKYFPTKAAVICPDLPVPLPLCDPGGMNTLFLYSFSSHLTPR